MSARRRALLLLFALGLAGSALGAARARLGGTLAIGLVGVEPPRAGALADAPEAATARTLLALPLCRLDPGGRPVPVLGSTARRTESGQELVAVVPDPAARFPDGGALGVRDIAESWRRLGLEDGARPYRALFAPVAGLEAALEAAGRTADPFLALPLAYPWPDLEASLCHPLLTPTRTAAGGPPVGIGLYRPAGGAGFEAALGPPAGRPFPAALSLSTVPSRTAPRLLREGALHAVLGEDAGGAGPQLFATYFVYRRGAVPEGAVAVVRGLDLASLVRTFVPGPAVPMRALLPPALIEGGAPPPAPPPVPPGATARSFRLGYDADLPEHRAVAERLQVKLHDGGYRVALVGLDRAALQRARERGEVETALVSVLLPPLPAPALAVVLEAAGAGELLARELPPLGALADGGERAARARARAAELAPSLPVVPLFARGLRVRLSPALVDARQDAFGLLVLDDAWLVR